jgi:hypothetical protein
MIKMIVSDLDGTLLDSNMIISKENIEAITKARQQNIRFCVATGRNEQLVKEYIQPLSMTDPLILCNGGVIGHPFQKEKLLDIHLNTSDLREIAEYTMKHKINCMFYTSEYIISALNNNSRIDFFQERNKSLDKNVQTNFVFMTDIDEILSHKINKMLIAEHNEEKMKEIKRILQKHSNFNITSWSPGYLDINGTPASKGHALKVLCDHFGYKLEEICVFGDQDNDISMLEIAGISVCMENGIKEAKEASNFVTKSNNESGVAHFINTHLLV